MTDVDGPFNTSGLNEPTTGVHSFGGGSKVLVARKLRGESFGNLREVLLAANSEIFKRDVVPALSSVAGMHRTIYASSNDLALKASESVHEFRRVGQTVGGVLVYPGFDTIDASGVATYRREWGHSYIFDSQLALSDLIDSIVSGKSVADRSLRSTGQTPNRYWILQ